MDVTFGGMFPAIAGLFVAIAALLAARRVKSDIEQHKAVAAERAARDISAAE